MNRLRDWISRKWCNLAHGGGIIKRDSAGRINWQCGRCGRWAEPVPLVHENAMTDAAIDAAKDEK